VLEMGQRFMEIARQYPKIGKYVFIYHPDLQGPMDICEVLWGSTIFYATLDEPALVKDLLELAVATYTAFLREWEKIVPFRPEGNAHWGLYHKGKIMLRDDYTGKIEAVNCQPLDLLLQAGYTPVVAPLAISPEGDALNVDADRAAAMLAGALHAEKLLLLTNVPGLMRDLRDPMSLVERVPVEELPAFRDLAHGRMRRKLEAAELSRCARVVLADGRHERPIEAALDGSGTHILREVPREARSA